MVVLSSGMVPCRFVYSTLHMCVVTPHCMPKIHRTVSLNFNLILYKALYFPRRVSFEDINCRCTSYLYRRLYDFTVSKSMAFIDLADGIHCLLDSVLVRILLFSLLKTKVFDLVRCYFY